MKVRIFLAFGSVGVLLGGSFVACGGDAVVAKDASVADTSIADTSVPDTSDAAPPCPVQGNLQDLLKFDASGIDAAGVNLTVCFDCLKTNCKSDIDKCSADCDCKTGVVNFATCVQSGNKITTCGGALILGLTGNAQAIATGLLGCAQGSCSSQCIPPDGGSPKDAATDDGG
jgi:hypothetical protein